MNPRARIRSRANSTAFGAAGNRGLPQRRVATPLRVGIGVVLLCLACCKSPSDFGAIAKSGSDASQQLAAYYSQLQDTTHRTLQLIYFLDGLRGISNNPSYDLLRQRRTELEKRRVFATSLAAMYTSFSALVSTNDKDQIAAAVKDVSSSLMSLKVFKTAGSADDTAQKAVTGLLNDIDQLLRERKAERIAPRLQALNEGVVSFLHGEAAVYESFGQDYNNNLRNVGVELINGGYADPTSLLADEITALGLTPVPGSQLSAQAKLGYENVLRYKGDQIASGMTSALHAIIGAFTALGQAYADVASQRAASSSSVKSFIEEAASALGGLGEQKKGADNGNAASK